MDKIIEKDGKKYRLVEDEVKTVVSRYDDSEVLLRYNGKIKDADLRGADLRRANLKDTDLRGANLKGARTINCTINFSPSEYEQAKQFVEGLRRE